MKRILVSALIALGTTCAVRAQDSGAPVLAASTNTAADFRATSASRVDLVKPLNPSTAFLLSEALAPNSSIVTALAVPVSASDPGGATSAAAEPPPAPQPKFMYGSRDDYRWQLALGFAFYRFRSTIFDASAVGVNTDIAYYLSESWALEGNVSSVFAPVIASNAHVKIVTYGGGIKYGIRKTHIEPWGHALFGGTHVFPQTAAGSKNGLAIQAGGGVDYRWHPRLAFRGEADYVPTKVWGMWQHNFQIIAAVVFHF
ncbi:MAG TPA: hypothetical protein VOA64_15560 [Candidatus Dormibacteraeota bacterium]|nr:hypothetical protein [Candidatus Dormibacteraeota bacterium]